MTAGSFHQPDPDFPETPMLVRQLRRRAELTDDWTSGEVMLEAADEIERLRRLRTEVEALAAVYDVETSKAYREGNRLLTQYNAGKCWAFAHVIRMFDGTAGS
jgi:hypothetical protein